MKTALCIIVPCCVAFVFQIIMLLIENHTLEEENLEYKRMIMEYIIMDLKKLKEEQEYDDEEEEEEDNNGCD